MGKIILFSVMRNVNIFLAIRRRIKKILIAFFAIVRFMCWEKNVEEIFVIRKKA